MIRFHLDLGLDLIFLLDSAARLQMLLLQTKVVFQRLHVLRRQTRVQLLSVERKPALLERIVVPQNALGWDWRRLLGHCVAEVSKVTICDYLPVSKSSIWDTSIIVRAWHFY